MVRNDPVLQYQRMHDKTLKSTLRQGLQQLPCLMAQLGLRINWKQQICDTCQYATSYPLADCCPGTLDVAACDTASEVPPPWYLGALPDGCGPAAGWPGICPVGAAVATCCTTLLNTFNALFNAWMFTPVDPGAVAILIYINKNNAAKNSVVEELIMTLCTRMRRSIQYASYTGVKELLSIKIVLEIISTFMISSS